MSGIGSSFTYLNSWTSGRGVLTPHGFAFEPSVFCSNLIAARTALMCDLAMCLGCVVVVEQPDHKGGLFSLAAWQRLAERHIMYKMKCLQGCYSASTVKPTVLVSNHSRFMLKHTLDATDKERIKRVGKTLVVRKHDGGGRLRVTGKPKALKSTQQYTPEFGRAIAKCWEMPRCDPCIHYLLLHFVVWFLEGGPST